MTTKSRSSLPWGKACYKFTLGDDAPEQAEVDLYPADSLADLAAQFVEEGLYGDIPKQLRNYIDNDAIVRDLSVEYAEVQLDGTRYIYRCG